MAWRIDEQLLRAEIDNRIRGRVTGNLWLIGREQPVTLDLAGNAWRGQTRREIMLILDQVNRLIKEIRSSLD